MIMRSSVLTSAVDPHSGADQANRRDVACRGAALLPTLTCDNTEFDSSEPSIYLLLLGRDGALRSLAPG